VAFGSRSSFDRPAGGGRRGGRGRDAPEGDPPEPPADPEQTARQICLHQLEFAPRTRAELAVTLAKRGVPDDVAETVLGRFAEVGMIDDALFSQMWVTSRHRGRGLAGRALEQELRRKGVDDETAKTALDALHPDEERATARSLVERRLGATRGLTTDARVRRLAGMLARKGYPAGVAFGVVREALAAEGAVVEIGFDELQGLED
jgi:regulatory protein